MNVNINDEVMVKLTPIGIKIMRDRQNTLNELYNIKPDLKLDVDKNGYCKFQLWELMSIFGEHMCMGTDVPFKTNIIINTNKTELNIVDKIKYIQEKLPKKYELLIRTNKGENTFNPDGGDWFVHLSKETGSYLQNHNCSTKSLHKEYGNNLGSMLNKTIEIVDKLSCNQSHNWYQ